MRLAPLFLALCLTSGSANQTSVSDLKPRTPQTEYPDTDEGLKRFISDLADAHTTGKGVQGRMHALLIPNDSEWFIRVFGPRNGPLLDFQYRSQLGYYFSRLYNYLPIYGKGPNRSIHTAHSEPGHISPFVTDSGLITSAEQPLRIYSASIATNETGPWVKVGTFVYDEGNFRYLCTPSLETDWRSFYAYYDRRFEP